MSVKEDNQEESLDTQSTANKEPEKEKPKSKKRWSKTAKLEAALAEKEGEFQEMKDKFLRLMAEFENFKKRMFKESLEIRKTAAKDVMLDLLPILDDFDRAKQAADDDTSPEYFSEGIALVYEKFKNTLQNRGLEAINPTGEAFNSEEHEAITKIPAPDAASKGQIIDTIEKGYKLNDAIIRHPKVVVGD